MKTPIRRTPAFALSALVVLTLAFDAGLATGHAAIGVGGTAANFTLTNHKTGQPLRLYDYVGSVILLDFWAYWCGPCATAAQDMEPNIVQYYYTNGGNAYGVPVTVISISLDPSDPAAVNNFISTYGLELVADDSSGTAYGQHGNGYIPYMVVINGATNSTNYRAWEVLYSSSGYSRSAIKAKIDAVQTPAPVCNLTSPLNGAVLASNVPVNASVATNGKIIKRVEFYSGATLIGTDTNAPYGLVWTNPPAGGKALTGRAYYGTGYSAITPAVNFTVGTPPPVVARITQQGMNRVLTWTGCAAWYQVQMATNLTNPVWVNVGTSSTNMSLSLAQTNRTAFYRLLKQ